jgi:hypothetical protein
MKKSTPEDVVVAYVDGLTEGLSASAEKKLRALLADVAGQNSKTRRVRILAGTRIGLEGEVEANTHAANGDILVRFFEPTDFGWYSPSEVEDVPSCRGVIPNTFIACGEGENYCSDECLSYAAKRRMDDCTCASEPTALCPTHHSYAR